MGTATMTASSARSREGKQRSEGEGGPESEGEVRGGRGGAWRHQRARGGSRRWPEQGGGGAHGGVAVSASFWRGGRRQGSSGGGLGRAAGPGGLPGERQVVLLSLSLSVFIYLFCSVLF